MCPDVKSPGCPSAVFAAVGAICNRKSEATVNTNFDLNRRASLRPYF
jgi:hypothetical protein